MRKNTVVCTYCVGRIYLEVPYQLLKKCRLDSEKLPSPLDFVAYLERFRVSERFLEMCYIF